MALFKEHNRLSRKGATLGGWIEVAAFSVAFIVLLSVIIFPDMNYQHNENFAGDFGIQSSDVQNNLTSYQEQLQSNINTGQANTETITGLSVTTIWQMIKGGFTMTFYYLTGGWIEQISTNLIGFPSIVAFTLRVLFLISIGLIAIKLILKVKA